MLNTKRVRAGYNRIATRYAEKRDQVSSVRFLKMLDGRLAPNSLILDLGCGAGVPVDRWLVAHRHRVVGLDISEAMIALARENVPMARYHVHDMATLREAEFSVGAVVSFFAMFHVDRRRHQDVFRCVRSYLPEGGFLLTTTGRSNWEGEEDFLGVQMPYSQFDKAANRDLIEGSGFEILAEDVHQGISTTRKDTWHPIFLARARATTNA